MSWKNGSAFPDKREGLWSLALLVAVGCATWALFRAVDYHWHWASLTKYWQVIAIGWGWTVLISLAALVLSVLLGTLLMLGLRNSLMPVRLFSRGYLEVIRGTPLLVQILIGYYIVANAVNISARIPTGIALLSLYEAAYFAEIFRGALESISASQLEAARAVGFDSRQIWRFVIFPQAVRRALPGTTGEMISLIKGSSLLSLIGVTEVTKQVQQANANAYTALEGFIPLALLYLVLTLPLSWWTRRLETKFKYET